VPHCDVGHQRSLLPVFSHARMWCFGRWQRGIRNVTTSLSSAPDLEPCFFSTDSQRPGQRHASSCWSGGRLILTSGRSEVGRIPRWLLPMRTCRRPTRNPGIIPIGLGGGTNCWFGQSPRLHPSDFALFTRYGVGRDWPVTYDELEP